MLFWKAKEIFEGGGELLKAEAELAGARLRRALVVTAIILLLSVLAFTGLLIVLAGAVIVLAPSLGWGGALASVGAAVMVLTGLSWVLHASFSRGAAPRMAIGAIGEAPLSPEAEVAQAKERMANAVHEQKPRDTESDHPISGLKDDAVDFAMRNPDMIGAAALLVLSVIGPGRSLRLISKGIATVSLLHGAIEMLSKSTEEDADQDGEEPRHTRTRASRGGRQPTQSNVVQL